MSHAYETAAVTILDSLHKAEEELIGACVVTMPSCETGTVKAVVLNDFHGLCFTIDDEVDPVAAMNRGVTRRWYPVSTIKEFS